MNTILGNFILNRRKELLMSQNDLASMLNVSVSTISKWENGERTPDLTLIAPIATALQVEIEGLLENDIDDKVKYVGEYEFDINKFATNFSIMRKLNNYSLVSLGEKLGVSYQTISKWENGESLPNIYILNECAALFGVSLSSLYFGIRFIETHKKINKKPKRKIIKILLIAGITMLTGLVLLVIFNINGVPKIVSSGDFEYIDKGDRVEIIKCKIDLEEIIIPKTIGDNPVVRIHKDAFENNFEKIKIISIPGTLVYDDSFLEQLVFLEKIIINADSTVSLNSLFNNNIPESFTTIEVIGDDIFYIPTSILGFSKELTLVIGDKPWSEYNLLNGKDVIGKIIFRVSQENRDKSIDAINNLKLFELTKLKEFIFETDLDEIAPKMFKDCVNLEKVIPPQSLVVIGQEAFMNCRSLKEFTFPLSVDWICTEAFKGCESIKEIFIPKEINCFDGGAFENCINLEKIIFGDGVSNIPSRTCYNCFNLKEVYIPGTVTYILDDAFSGCHFIENVHYNGTLEEWNKILMYTDDSNILNVSENAVLHTND